MEATMILKKKAETVSEKYIDLLDRRISAASQDDLIDGTVMSEIGDGIKCLHHAITILERISRLDRNGDSDGSSPMRIRPKMGTHVLCRKPNRKEVAMERELSEPSNDILTNQSYAQAQYLYVIAEELIRIRRLLETRFDGPAAPDRVSSGQ